MSILKNVLIFGGGLIIGAFAAKRKYEEIIDEYEQRYDREEETDQRTSAEEETAATKIRVVGSLFKSEKTKERYDKIVEKLGYNNSNITESEKTNEESDYNKYEEMSKQTADEINKSPYIITYDEFNNECEHYDKLSIYFYARDKILADEDDTQIDDPELIVGELALSSFGKEEDPDIVHVRNEKLQIDYEIIKLDKDYSQTVLGELGDE